MPFEWPEGFARVPDEEWTRQPLGELAIKYDTVEGHGWYSNLDRTIDQLGLALQAGDVVVDYSGGTGILAERLLRRIGTTPVGIVIVDSSPKFLRLALEKLCDEPRLAFRLIRHLKEERRLQLLDEVLGPTLVSRRVDALASTNAIHLYYDLEDTLRSWARVMRPRAGLHVQSGNVGNPDAAPGEWIIDETVEAVHRAAIAIVRTDDGYAAYRPVLGDAGRMAAHDAVRRKFFLPVRPLSYYLDALCAAGFEDLAVTRATIEARVDDWYDFVSVYHEGVLGWVGGSERVEGSAPPEAALDDRRELIRRAMSDVFAGRETFPCCWTYITARRAG